MIGWSSYSIEPGYFGCSITWYSTSTSDRAFTVCLLLLFFVCPLLINLCCYRKIYLQMRILAKRDNDRWGNQSLAAQETLEAKKQCSKIALCMVSGFLFAWSPYAIVSMCTTFGYHVSPLATTAAAMFAKTSSLCNPIVLIFLHRNFRKRLVNMITCSVRRREYLRNTHASYV